MGLSEINSKNYRIILDKENVIAVLDAIDGLEFLATYNPDGYAPYNYIAEEQEDV